MWFMFSLSKYEFPYDCHWADYNKSRGTWEKTMGNSAYSIYCKAMKHSEKRNNK